MIKKAILFMAIGWMAISIATSQEIITGMAENPLIIEEISRMEQMGEADRSSVRDEMPRLMLPFFDDFSQAWIFPAQSRWADEYAYINTNFGYHSANRGVATLDAIDDRGRLHPNASTYPFGADTLTSQRIRLDSIFFPVHRELTPADSIYLSFYYQPQGRANPPEPFDSLFLSFGYYSGNMVFSGLYDSIAVPLSLYITPQDTVYPGDTVYSPSNECDEGLYVISDRIYTYDDIIQVPCDSIMEPEYVWKKVWRSPGMTLQKFKELYGVYSRQVMIPVVDTIFFQADFRFRFDNIASLATENSPSWRGNCDQWNLDYVYLDRDRSFDDTTYRDVGFVDRAPSLLKNYEAMPYKQYVNDLTNEMKDNIELLITNLDSITYNSNFYYAVYEVDGPFQYTYPGGNCNLGPVYEFGYQDCISCAAHACPPVNFIFPLATRDSAEFEIRYHIIGDITPVDTVSDTLKFRQKFHNYYAYDDGSPEEGYGLSPTGAKLAYRFNLNTKDTLRAVQMYFNRTMNNANEVFFNLVVWRDNNGKPGDAIYTQPMQRVTYSESLRDFHTYYLDEGVAVNGTFYIGWTQLSPENLNIGYDRYNNAQQHIFYNTDGVWYQSTYQGALLMRPLIGKKWTSTGTQEFPADNIAFSVSPNPVRGEEFHIRHSDSQSGDFRPEDYRIRIFTTLGTVIFDGPYRETLRSVLPSSGVYLVVVTGNDHHAVFTAKIIKQ